MNISRLLEAEYKYKIGEVLMNLHWGVACYTEAFIDCEDVSFELMARVLRMYDVMRCYEYKILMGRL